MSEERIKELETALDQIYDIAFKAHLWGKFQLGKLISPWEEFEKITDIIDIANPDEDEE